MKNLFSTIVAFSVLLLIGCQKNPITDPISADPVNKFQNQDGTITQGLFFFKELYPIRTVAQTNFLLLMEA